MKMIPVPRRPETRALMPTAAMTQMVSHPNTYASRGNGLGGTSRVEGDGNCCRGPLGTRPASHMKAHLCAVEVHGKRRLVAAAQLSVRTKRL